ncbi:MAG: hypothetical protein ACI9MC_002710 [Kiritimatiellia bacterium]|jgi:hypothetical protein
MKYLPLLLVLLAPISAHAFTSRQTGIWFDAHGGLAIGGTPIKAGLGYRGSVGILQGNYDRSYALGRSWGIGATVHHHVDRHLATMLEVRRHIDLLVLGVRLRAMAGPEWEQGKMGATARVGAGLKIRPTPIIGPTIDIEGGASYIDGVVSPRFGVHLGVEISIPVAGREPKS